MAKILQEGNTAVGIELADGRRVTARTVVSNADPKRTFSELLGDVEAVRRNEWSTNISYQKFHSVVSELPDLRAYFDGEQPDPRKSALLRIAPSMQLNREALSAAQEGELPEVPFIGAIFIPSVFDSSLAPAGHHALSAWIGYAPGRLAHGSWDAAREEAGKRFINRVQEFIPNFADSLVEWKMLLAVDIEARTSLTDGNIRHLDVVPGQYWDDRPVKGWGQRTPVDRLYLCGVGTHPGGEVTGAPGFNAARAIREDEEVGSNEIDAGDPLLLSMG